MLGQRLDRRQRLQRLGAHPVIGELLGMEACPSSDEPQRTRRKRPIENPQRGDLDLRNFVAVLGMEVRRRMIGTVHPDDDSVERGQARHRAILGDGAADMADSHQRAIELLPRAVRLVQHCSSEVELVEALSNSEVQDQMERLAAKLKQIAASDVRPRSSARSDRRLRSGLVPKAIMQVLSESVEPMRMRDIHAEVERVLDRSVSRSAVKNWLAGHTGGETALFVRIERGRYVTAGARTATSKCEGCSRLESSGLRQPGTL